MRLKIAENMVRAVSEAPHVTAVFEADFSAVAAHKAALAARGTKLSYTAYIVKAAAEAMAVAPAINGRWEKDRIAISPTIDIGVGTALGEKGLVVPVVKDAGSLSLEQIGARLDDLTRRARDGKLERSDVSGGSFTISNHGVSGSLLAAPIILHQGQAAILGIGKLEKRVVVREIGGEDAILVRPMAYVTLTIDHRVVDGHQTNAWLTRFVEILGRLAGALDVGLVGRDTLRNVAAPSLLAAAELGADAVAGHRQRPHRIAPDQRLHRLARRGRQPGEVEQRDEMVRRRHGERIVRMLRHLRGSRRDRPRAARRPHRRTARAQSKPASGWFHCMRRRLWTTLPLPRIITPRSRSGASRAPRST